jgi:hypothetical protein
MRYKITGCKSSESHNFKHIHLATHERDAQTCRLSFPFFRRDSSQRAKASSLNRFLDHTQQCATFGRTPLYEGSARRRDLYLTTHNTHNRETSMPPVGFELTIPASEWPQTDTLDRVATGIGRLVDWIA